MTSSEHWHIIAVQDHDTTREWWTIRTNSYDQTEAEQQARRLLTEDPAGQADDDVDDQAEADDDHREPAWSAIWLTSCTDPCAWAAVPPSHTWTLPPPGDPWWTVDGVQPRPPARTRSVALTTVQTATWAELRQMGLSDTDLKMLGAADADLAQPAASGQPASADAIDTAEAAQWKPAPSPWEVAARHFDPPDLSNPPEPHDLWNPPN